MNKGFYDRQLKMLASPLDETRVQSREHDGRALLYIEGWYALAEANAIFGYDGWDRETVYFEKLFERTRGESTNCGYAARVRITVRTRGRQVVREGTGFGQALAVTGDAHERAMKAAETDATKRALSTFGGRFGLLLYDKARREKVQRSPEAGNADERDDHLSDHAAAPVGTGGFVEPGAFVLVTLGGESWKVGSPEAFCSGLRQMIEATTGSEDLNHFWRANLVGLAKLREWPALTTTRGEHFADVLERLMAKRTRQLKTGLAKPAGDNQKANKIEQVRLAGRSMSDDAMSARSSLTEVEAFVEPGHSPQQGISTAPTFSKDGVGQKDKGANSPAFTAPEASRLAPMTTSEAMGSSQTVTGSLPENIACEVPSQLTSQDRRDQNHPAAPLFPSTGSSVKVALSVPANSGAPPAKALIGARAKTPEESVRQTGDIAASHISRTPQISLNRSERLDRVSTSIRPFVPVPPYPLRGISEKISLPRERAGGDTDFSKPRDIANACEVADQDSVHTPQNGECGAIGGNIIVSVEDSAEPNGRAGAPVPPANLPTRRSQISGGFSVDKSVLSIPSERRLRSKAHLVMVASKPCAVCESTPCHAHHVTFAQPRGLSLKVSDEYTVPLCVQHHNEVHASGKEASWWRSQGIDPLSLARKLWFVTTGGEAIPTPAFKR